jgi:hypothetical protein
MIEVAQDINHVTRNEAREAHYQGARVWMYVKVPLLGQYGKWVQADGLDLLNAHEDMVWAVQENTPTQSVI